VEVENVGIGVSVFLIALGAILAFATNVSVSGVDLTVVGIVLIVAGVIGLLVTLVIWGPRRRTERVERTAYSDPVRTRRRVIEDEPVIEERRTYDDPTL
jgi:hypothetical protein